jgi:hypothetical protein
MSGHSSNHIGRSRSSIQYFAALPAKTFKLAFYLSGKMRARRNSMACGTQVRLHPAGSRLLSK